MRKWKYIISLLTIFLLSASFSIPALAANATNGAEIDTEITTANGDTAYICQVAEHMLYIEVDSDGMTWPLDTSNAFAPTVVTVLDASGKELGTLESVQGVISYDAYPDATILRCTTDFSNDSYDVELSAYEGTGKEQPEFVPEDMNKSGNTLNDALNIVKICSYVVIGIWVIIWIITIPKAIKEGYFSEGKKKKQKKSPFNGIWELKIETPHGSNEGELTLSYDGASLNGILNDVLNEDVPLREGKIEGSTFEGLINIDIGMNGSPEFRIHGELLNDNSMKGELVLTAMETIRSSFEAKRKEV